MSMNNSSEKNQRFLSKLNDFRTFKSVNRFSSSIDTDTKVLNLVQSNNLDELKFTLLNQSIDLTLIRNSDGLNLLHICCCNDFSDVMEYLMQYVEDLSYEEEKVK